VGAVPVGLALRGLADDAADALDDVADVGEVALHLAVVEHLNGFTRQDGFHEEEVGHVWPAPGPVDGEEAEARGGQLVEVAVGVGHQLVALLGGGVERHGVVHIVAGREGHLLIQSVDAARAGVHQVRDVVVAAAFQDIAEPNDVALHVGAGVLDAVTHARLRRQVRDVGKLVVAKEVLQGRQVLNFSLDEVVVGVHRALDQLSVGDRVARNPRRLQPRDLQTDIVVVVDAV
jgi:hypothetical protein